MAFSKRCKIHHADASGMLGAVEPPALIISFSIGYLRIISGEKKYSSTHSSARFLLVCSNGVIRNFRNGVS